MDRAGAQFGRHIIGDPRTIAAQRSKTDPAVYDTCLHMSPSELQSMGIDLYCNSMGVMTVPREYQLELGLHIHTVSCYI